MPGRKPSSRTEDGGMKRIRLNFKFDVVKEIWDRIKKINFKTVKLATYTIKSHANRKKIKHERS